MENHPSQHGTGWIYNSKIQKLTRGKRLANALNYLSNFPEREIKDRLRRARPVPGRSHPRPGFVDLVLPVQIPSDGLTTRGAAWFYRPVGWVSVTTVGAAVAQDWTQS